MWEKHDEQGPLPNTAVWRYRRSIWVCRKTMKDFLPPTVILFELRNNKDIFIHETCKWSSCNLLNYVWVILLNLVTFWSLLWRRCPYQINTFSFSMLSSACYLCAQSLFMLFSISIRYFTICCTRIFPFHVSFGHFSVLQSADLLPVSDYQFVSLRIWDDFGYRNDPRRASRSLWSRGWFMLFFSFHIHTSF